MYPRLRHTFLRCFFISDVTNSSSYFGKSPGRKSMLENSDANFFYIEVKGKLKVAKVNFDLGQGTFQASTFVFLDSESV